MNLTPEQRRKKQDRERRWYIKNKERRLAPRRAAYAAKKKLGPVWTPEQREKRLAHCRKWNAKHSGYSWAKRRAKRDQLATRPRPDHCEVCGAPANKCRWGKLALDHSHKTGGFRGWLCYSCNTILGHANDDPEILRALIAYLERGLP